MTIKPPMVFLLLYGFYLLFLCLITIPNAGSGSSSFSHSASVEELSSLTKYVNQDRVMSNLKQLASFNEEVAQPGMQRIIFSKEDVKARNFLRGLFNEAGLEVREDAIGNMFGRWVGDVDKEGVVGSGSHYDAIPGSGKYDGTVGVIGALEAIRALKEAGFKPRRSLEVIAFTSEEPTRFGVGCVGSRALVGQMKPREIAELIDDDGVSFEEARKAAGYSQKMELLTLETGYFSHFLELHIEQGPLLEENNVDIGIVTGIAGPASMRLEFRGPGGHAGSVLMKERKDAGLAGAELALFVDKTVRDSGSADMVGTTSIVTYPRAINSIPRVVDIGIDLRDIDLKARNEVLDKIQKEAQAIAQRRGVELFKKQFSADAPAICDQTIVEKAELAANGLGLQSQRMKSRAYHDTSMIAQRFPAAMVFIPCRDGVSHHPSEFTSAQNIVKGIKVLAGTIAKLAETMLSNNTSSQHDEL